MTKTQKVIYGLELSPYFVPLFIIGVGLLMMFGSYDDIKITNIMINIGWVFLLGGESYLGISVVEHYYKKASQKNQNEKS